MTTVQGLCATARDSLRICSSARSRSVTSRELTTKTSFGSSQAWTWPTDSRHDVGSIAAAEPVAYHDGLNRILQADPHGLDDPSRILGVDELEGGSADHLRRRESDVPLDRRTLVVDDPLGIDDGDQVRGVLDERSEVGFAPAEGLLGCKQGRLCMHEAVVMYGSLRRGCT